MLDVKQLRQEIDLIAKRLQARGFALDKIRFLQWESERKRYQEIVQMAQSQRNQLSKQIGVCKSRGEDVAHLIQESEAWAVKLKEADQRLSETQAALTAWQLEIPNIPDPSVPIGASEKDNQEIRRHREVPSFDFIPKNHVVLGEAHGDMDFESAAKLSGSRFVVLHDRLAKLQRALADFMLDLHTQQQGYQEVYVPYLVHEQCLYGTGQLPKFREDQFHISGGWNLTLIPTAEVPLVNLLRDHIFQLTDLPKKWVAKTPCFRSEAGSYGKDVRGLIRQHQFQKVELVQAVKPEDSSQALESLTQEAERVLQLLKLPYRVMALCTGDLGFSAARTYDLEVWLPSQQTYREISSCSNCTDFQARRMQARFRDPDQKKPVLLHTLNGSALAIDRTLVAVMENYQQSDGNIQIPEVLQSYMGGLCYLY